MKNKIFRYSLFVLGKLAKMIQIGNLKRKAPVLIFEQQNVEKLKKNSKVDDADIWKLHNATCSSNWGGAVINESNTVYEKFVSFPWGKKYHPVFSLPYLGSKAAIVDKAIFLVTPEAKGNYYHWVIDLLPRLLLIKKLEVSDFKERTIILHTPARRYEDDTLSLLQIKSEKILRLKPFQIASVEDLILTDYINYGEKFPVWKKYLLQELKSNENASAKRKFKKIYLQRGNQKKRRLIGEERLIAVLKQNDFEIIDPQQLSFTEQIEVLSMAQVVVSLHGAALTNIVFCKEGALVVEIRSSVQPPEFFSEIAKTCNLQFKTLSISPKQNSTRANIANKQNLILTDDKIYDLIMQIKVATEEKL